MKKNLLFLITVITCLFSIPRANAQYSPESLFAAARSGNFERVSEFLDSGLSKESINNALGAAVVGQQIEVMDLLLRHGANVNHFSSWNTSLLNNAIMLGFTKSAERLITAGANPNAYGYKRKERKFTIDWNWTPLMCAAFRGESLIVHTLIDHGADPTLKGWSFSPNQIETAADIAAYSGHLDILKHLLELQSPLRPETIYQTVRGGHIDTLKFLLDKYPLLNSIGPNGKTLLMEASWWGHIDIIEYLISQGADVNFQNSAGSTALIETVSNPDRNLKHQLEVVKQLIELGADISITKNGVSAAQIAQQNNKKNILQYLDDIKSMGN